MPKQPIAFNYAEYERTVQELEWFKHVHDLDLRTIAELESEKAKLINLLSDPLIIFGENNTLRPVKGTSRQEVYEKLLKAQFLVGIPNRWFPEEWRCARKSEEIT